MLRDVRTQRDDRVGEEALDKLYPLRCHCFMVELDDLPESLDVFELLYPLLFVV